MLLHAFVEEVEGRMGVSECVVVGLLVAGAAAVVEGLAICIHLYA